MDDEIFFAETSEFYSELIVVYTCEVWCDSKDTKNYVKNFTGRLLLFKKTLMLMHLKQTTSENARLIGNFGSSDVPMYVYAPKI
jgi:hypothetical protein